MILVKPLKECSLCGKELAEPSFIEKNGRVLISGYWAFHLYETHGLPVGIVVQKVRGQLAEIWEANVGGVPAEMVVWPQGINN